MPSTLTLDLGLDFGRALPGEVGPAQAPVPVPPATTGTASSRRLTLDDVVVGVWEGLRTAQPASCPICDGIMEPRFGSGPAPVGGRCRDCGTTLA